MENVHDDYVPPYGSQFDHGDEFDENGARIDPPSDTEVGEETPLFNLPDTVTARRLRKARSTPQVDNHDDSQKKGEPVLRISTCQR